MKKIIGLVAIGLLIAGQAMATITYTNTITTGPYADGGNSMKTIGELNLSGTYVTNGFTFTGDQCGVSHIQSVLIQGEDGYQFWYNGSTGKILAFQTATITPAGTVAITPHADSAGTPAGTNASTTIAVTYTDTTSGMVPLYVTDTSGTISFYAVFTTDTSATRSITVPAETFTGTAMSTHSHASTAAFTGTATTAAPLAEVTNGASLAGVDKITYICIGY